MMRISAGRQQRTTTSACGRTAAARPHGNLKALAKVSTCSRKSQHRGSLLVQAEEDSHGVAGGINDYGKCPMLNALRTLPPSKVNSWESLTFALENPTKFQEKALAGSPMAEGTYFGKPAIVVGDLGLAKEVMAGDGEFTEVGYPASCVTLLGPNAITMTNDVERHRYLRRLMTPGLASEEMDAALPRLAVRAENLLEGWATEGDAGRKVSALQGLKSFTFSIILSIVFGPELKVSAPKQAQLEGYFDTLVEGLQVAPELTVNMWPFPYARSISARAKLVEFIIEQVSDIRSQLAEVGSNPLNLKRQGGYRFGALQGILLARNDAGVGLTDTDVADNVVTLLFAGLDTTSCSLASALHQIFLNPAVMQKMRAEQQEIIAKYGTSFTPEVMRRMQYIEAVTRETLRFHPIISNIPRRSTKSFNLWGAVIPDGKPLLVALSNILLQDPRWAGATGDMAADVFNPDRFMSADGKQAGDQVPFGIGSRNCLGMPLALAEMKIVLAVLARKYSYSADCDTAYKEFPIAEPKNGLPVFMQRYALGY